MVAGVLHELKAVSRLKEVFFYRNGVKTEYILRKTSYTDMMLKRYTKTPYRKA